MRKVQNIHEVKFFQYIVPSFVKCAISVGIDPSIPYLATKVGHPQQLESLLVLVGQFI